MAAPAGNLLTESLGTSSPLARFRFLVKCSRFSLSAALSLLFSAEVAAAARACCVFFLGLIAAVWLWRRRERGSEGTSISWEEKNTRNKKNNTHQIVRAAREKGDRKKKEKKKRDSARRPPANMDQHGLRRVQQQTAIFTDCC